MSNQKKAKYLLIGYGYWGPNLARNINKNDNSELAIVIDSSKEALENAKNQKVAEFYLDNIENINKSLIENIDIIVVATPPETHTEIIVKLAHFKKNFLVTKPAVTSSKEIATVKDLMQKYNFDIFVDETFIYSNKVKRIKEIINNSDFGELQYVYSNRSNLGLLQKRQDVVWDLAPHDLSIVSFITGKYPIKGQVITSNPLKIESNNSIATVHFKYENNFELYLNLSWLSPQKLRYMVFNGTKKTLVYQDNFKEKSLLLYKQNISIVNNQFDYKSDSGTVIEYQENEPLFDEINQLSKYIIEGGKKPIATFENTVKNIIALESLIYL
tara:strand:- start:62 stop:1045 length:984 start_codon:yes stop_codon:yes gene_type:complete